MVHVRRLWLHDFRSYADVDVELAPGLTVVVGDNGQGKTNLLEAIGWLATMRSFRRVANDVLVRAGAPEAIIRAEVRRGDRELLVEAKLARGQPPRLFVNRQRKQRASDLGGLVPAVVFSPGDLELVQAGPALRRDWLDDVCVQLHPRNVALRADLDKILRQRNALLKQAGGRRSDDIMTTLAVWNAKLTTAGEAWAGERDDALSRLAPHIEAAHTAVAGSGALTLTYVAPWRDAGLERALDEATDAELRRGVSLIGPHRDEITVDLGGMPARTQASQGEQRTVALAMRMAAHRLLATVYDTSPLLLLDDAFSELDEHRAQAVVDHLDAEQTVLTSTSAPRAIDGVVLTVADAVISRATAHRDSGDRP